MTSVSAEFLSVDPYLKNAFSSGKWEQVFCVD